MKYKRLKCRNLRSGKTQILTIGDRIGSGGQGVVHPVYQVNSKPVNDWLIKIYSNTSVPVRKHALGIAKYFEKSSNDIRTGGLSGLPREPLETEDGRFAFMLYKVPGSIWEDPNVRNTLRESNLSLRLNLSSQLARLVSRLHKQGVVHADITHPNVLFDLSNLTIFLIDVDGGGILKAPNDRSFSKNLSPIAQYQASCGSIIPPEIRNGAKPSVHSDLWALVIMIHHILMPYGFGIDPFSYWTKPTHYITEPNLPWPPDPDQYPKAAKGIYLHLDYLNNRLGKKVGLLFKRTFGDYGRKNPDMRPTADLWTRELERSASWVVNCSSCQKQFVARDVYICPHCDKQHVPHAVMTIGSKKLFLTDDKVIRGIDFGIRNKRGNLFQIKRFGDSFEITPFFPLKEAKSHRPINASFRIGVRKRPFKFTTYLEKIHPSSDSAVNFKLLIPPWNGVSS